MISNAAAVGQAAARSSHGAAVCQIDGLPACSSLPLHLCLSQLAEFTVWASCKFVTEPQHKLGASFAWAQLNSKWPARKAWRQQNDSRTARLLAWWLHGTADAELMPDGWLQPSEPQRTVARRSVTQTQSNLTSNLLTQWKQSSRRDCRLFQFIKNFIHYRKSRTVKSDAQRAC